MDILVPAGIGDISWVYSKISKLPREINLKIIGVGHQRGKPYTKMLPNVNSVEYIKMSTHELKAMEGPKTYQELCNWNEKVCPLIANDWLNEGNRIEKWLPGGPIDYYYKMNIPETDLLKDVSFPFGIAMASVEGNKSWNGWSPEEWLNFIKIIFASHSYITFVFLGAHYDIKMMRMLKPYLDAWDIPYINLIGKTSFPETMSIIADKLKYFMGFASGLQILSVRSKRPTAMLYPDRLENLMYAWSPPEMIAAGIYVPLLWDRPINVAKRLKNGIQNALTEDSDNMKKMEKRELKKVGDNLVEGPKDKAIRIGGKNE